MKGSCWSGYYIFFDVAVAKYEGKSKIRLGSAVTFMGTRNEMFIRD